MIDTKAVLRWLPLAVLFLLAIAATAIYQGWFR